MMNGAVPQFIIHHSAFIVSKEMSLLQLLLIAAIGFLGSFYGVVSGGGALIIIPGLIFVGLPGPTAVAAVRFGELGLSLTGALRFRRAGLVQVRPYRLLIAVAVAGAATGALLLLQADPTQVQRVFGVLTIAVAPLILLGRRIGLERPGVVPSARRRRVGLALTFLVAIYAGFFGGGWATFFTYIMVAAFGLTFLQGAATRTIVGIAMGSLMVVIFTLGGKIAAAPAAILFVSMSAGSYLGASMSLRGGESYARSLVVVIALLSGIKLLW